MHPATSGIRTSSTLESKAAMSPTPAITLRAWLVVGAVALVVFPPLRETDAWFGWLPFWLVVAPALDLLFLGRRHLLADARRIVARLHQRRRASRRQALPLSRCGARPRRRLRASAALPASVPTID